MSTHVLVRPKTAAWPRLMAFVVMSTVAMILASRFAIPHTPVPITLQVFVVVLSGLMLGRGASTAQAGFWVVLMSGAAVSATGLSGPAALFGPTGGYLIAFPIAALVIGRISERSDSLSGMIAAALAGLSAIYLIGAIWLAFYVHDIGRAISLGVTPFLLFDLGKCALAVAIAFPSRKHVHRWLHGGER